jgi:hypothetical protein
MRILLILSLLLSSCIIVVHDSVKRSPDDEHAEWHAAHHMSHHSGDRERGVSIFDGKTLKGWVTRGGHYDGDALWTVEDGAITGRQGPKGEGGLIYTERPYTDFELELDVKMDEPFDSGIFVRMAPVGRGAQVTLDNVEGGEVGAIYSDGFLAHNTTAKAKYKHGEWNHFRVVCSGADMHVEAWMNGEQIADHQVPEDSAAYAPTGLIGLQVHGNRDDPPQNKVQFKNITVRELSPAQTASFAHDAKGVVTPTAWGRAQGWRNLFNGTDLNGWEPAGASDGYAVKDGAIVLLTAGKSEYLRTLEDFQDFELRLDFKIAEMANSGLFLRGDRKGGDPAYSGCEVQILDDFHYANAAETKLKEWQLCGSLYGCVAPKVKALRPAGEWNTYEVKYQGSMITVNLNDEELYSVDTSTLADAKPPFSQRVPKGFIGLQRHAPAGMKGDAYAWFRNVYIKPIVTPR